jgi:PAS domain S-box-containing protein
VDGYYSDETLKIYKSIFKSSLDAIFLTSYADNKDLIFYANPAAATLFGYTEDEIYRLNWIGIVDTEDPKLEDFLKLLYTSDNAKGELIFIKKNGTKFPGEISANMVRDNNGNKTSSFSVVKDITKRKRAQKALIDSDARYRGILENLQDGYIRADKDGKIIMASPSAARMYRIESPNEMIGLNANSFYKNPEDRNDVLRELKKHGTVQDNELEALRDDGTSFWVSQNAQYHYDEQGHIQGTETFVRDITGRKRVEESLRISEERLRLAQIRGKVGVWDWNTVTDELNFTPELEQLYGLSKGSIKTYNDWRKLTHPDDIEKIEAERDANIAKHQPFDLEFRIFHKSGETRWLSARGGAIYNKEGEVVRVLGINTDITKRKRAEEELKRIGESFQTLADNIPNLAWMAGADGGITWYNKQWYEYTGTTFEEMQGWGWQKVHHPDHVKAIAEDWSRHLKDGEPYDDIFQLKGNDGNYRWFLTRVTPIRDEHGKIQRWFGTNTDITERKEIEEELTETLRRDGQLNRTLLALRNSSFAMMHATDEASYLEDICNIVVNDCGHSMVWIGLTEGDNLSVIPHAHAGFEEDYLNTLNIKLDDVERGRGPTGTAIRTGKPYICENMLTDPKFKPWREEAMKRGYKSSMVLPIISDMEVIGALNIYSRETNPFSTEEKKLLHELVDDISFGITSLRLRKAHEKAENALRESMIDIERSNAELEQFAYVTSHDLREPLRMITSFLQLLERRYKDQLDEDANEFIGFAVNGAKRLDAMINDILIYSRVAKKERNLTPVNLNIVLEQVYLNLKTSIEETNAELTQDKLPTLLLDEQLMIQLFQNIIANAIKYRSEKTPQIHISARKEFNQYVFSVQDNGIGISPEHLERIFTIFKRLHTNQEYEGTGIGLSIAQKIVQQHGGQIWAESSSDGGSTFHFSIPIIPDKHLHSV